jgi:hypothetical protein
MSDEGFPAVQAIGKATEDLGVPPQDVIIGVAVL